MRTFPSSADASGEVRGSAPMKQRYSLLGGVLLGLMSFVGDVAPGALGKVVTAIFSTGSAWCLLSVVVGYQYRNRLHSSLAAVGSLLLATLAYYGATVFSGVRFGGQTKSGSALSSVDWLTEISSMARGVAFWVAASVVAGTLMGYVGYLLRNGSGVWGTVAAGLTFGIAAGPGVNDLAYILRFGLNEATAQLVLPAACEMLVAISFLIFAAVIRSRQMRWSLLAAVSVSTCIGVAAVWELVNAARSQL